MEYFKIILKMRNSGVFPLLRTDLDRKDVRKWEKIIINTLLFRCWKRSPQPLQLSSYLRREGLRIKSQKPEDAFSPKRRSEGKHPTKRNFRRGHGGRAAAEEEARQTRIRCSSCRLAKLRKVKDPLSLSLSLSLSSLSPLLLPQAARLETNRERRNDKAHHVTAAQRWCFYNLAQFVFMRRTQRESLHSFGGDFLVFWWIRF